MGQKDKTPLLLKIVRWGFPKLERVAPFLAHRYFIRIFFTPLRYKVPAKDRKAETFATLSNLIVRGNKIQCYTWGTGATYVLLVHGWAGRATQFRRFIKPFLAQGIRVVGFDGPAHGHSEGKRTSLPDFEECLKQIVTREGKPRAIIAHSFGGVATLFAITRGLPITRVINIASPTIGDEVIKTYLRAINGSWKTGIFFKSYIQKTQGKSFEEFSALHLVKLLPQKMQLLLIHDENDKEVEIRHAEALLQVYPQAHLIRTRKLGHTRILKDDEVIRRCVTFVRDSASER
jgi:predicted alpha/beta hydrolase family esterase